MTGVRGREPTDDLLSYAGVTMTRLLISILGLLAWSGNANASQVVAPAVTTKAPGGATRVIVLWPRGAPGALGTGEGDVPKLYAYPVTDGSGGSSGQHGGGRTAVIVMPGGGYRSLSMEKEGAAEAEWLAERGVAAFVLEYRLGARYHFPAPMLDGARAVRYVRSHAVELGVAPDRIGVWGFSAGGHLAGYLATVNDGGNGKATEAIDRVSDRPDFAVLAYARLSMDPAIPRPMNLEALIGEHASPEMLNTVSIERHVTKDTSPCFLYSTTADQTVNSLNATAFYDALKRAGVPAELHIFERGRHGTGMGQGLRGLPELAIWPMLLENWMSVHGWIEARSAMVAGRP